MTRLLLALFLLAPLAPAQTRTFSATLNVGETATVTIAGPNPGATSALISIDGQADRWRAVENLSLLTGGTATFAPATAKVEVGIGASALVSASVGAPATSFPGLSTWDGTIDFAGPSSGSALLSGLYSASSGGPAAPWAGRRVVLWIRATDSPTGISGTTGALATQHGCLVTVNGTVTFN